MEEKLTGIEKLSLNPEKIKSRIGYHIVKRILDVVLSLVGLIVLSPLLVIIMICIKWEEPHDPIFYVQTRVGQGGQYFKMYKFRSMVVDAEKKLPQLLAQNEIDGAMFKIKDDPRVTNVGRFIRKYSLDELPQLWNVVKGDMSLVGPRPPLPREVASYSDYDKQRLLVMPGCTGLWQVTTRNDASFNEMVQLDLKYIRKSSIRYDLKLIIMTIVVMIHPNHAY
mgnify:CR=1 FL=1